MVASTEELGTRVLIVAEAVRIAAGTVIEFVAGLHWFFWDCGRAT